MSISVPDVQMKRNLQREKFKKQLEKLKRKKKKDVQNRFMVLNQNALLKLFPNM